MEESKKGIFALLVLCSVLFIMMNFVIVEQLPYYWLDYYGTKHRIIPNILLGFIIVMLFFIVVLPKSNSQIKEEWGIDIC